MSKRVILITGSRKGIGRYLTEQYLSQDDIVIGCSRSESDLEHKNYYHYCLDVDDEEKVLEMFRQIDNEFSHIDILINNAGVASMNHSLLTPISTVHKILNTNVIGTFLFSREVTKVMMRVKYGRIINFSTVAVPLKLEGEAIYTASKAAIESLTQTLAKEYALMGVTVNAIAPTPIKTDLIKNVPDNKIRELVERLSIKRLGTYEDIFNVVEFLTRVESNFITGQIIYLGGV